MGAYNCKSMYMNINIFSTLFSSDNCVFDGVEYTNGERFEPEAYKCNICTCNVSNKSVTFNLLPVFRSSKIKTSRKISKVSLFGYFRITIPCPIEWNSDIEIDEVEPWIFSFVLTKNLLFHLRFPERSTHTLICDCFWTTPDCITNATSCEPKSVGIQVMI